MKYLFDNWDEIAETVRHSPEILLLLDYDGTTVPIQKTPQQARLDEEMRLLIGELSGSPKKITAGIISGRSLGDICRLVGLEQLIYVGNHGLEILLPGRPLKRLYDKETLHLIQAAGKELRAQLDGVAGIIFEDKGPILAVHYRTARHGAEEAVLRAAKNLVAVKPGLAVRRGKMVVEITPDTTFNKGLAVKWLLDNLFPEEKPLVIFAGDDLTDEDAFAILSGRDVSIYVGPAAPDRFSARYYLKDTSEVRQFLFRLGKTAI